MKLQLAVPANKGVENRVPKINIEIDFMN